MITIFAATDVLDKVQQLINKEHRLNELVTVTATSAEDAALIAGAQIVTLPDWESKQPPVLLPVMPYSDEVVLGIIYTKLSNYEKAYEFLQAFPQLLQQVDLLNRLQNGISVTDVLPQQITAAELHNRAVAMQYGFSEELYEEDIIIDTYQKAIELSNDAEQKLFSNYHLSQLYIDLGDTDKAESWIENNLAIFSKKKISIAYKDLLCKIGLKKIKVPYDITLLENVKANLWECLEYYEANKRTVEAALVLMDASNIATISNSFSEALGYINRAITIFETEQLSGLLAQAHFTKGNLLQTWAQNGNPQFYRTAVQSYQSALRTFTKEEAPDIFAEIQHQLGRVYAEIPDEVKKKGVWAAVSVASFTEALNYYNKVDFPYEFAMICNSQGNAFAKYPTALHSDNYDKALAWYREALDVRTAEKHPMERVLTLSNYLEASWFAGNKDEFDQTRYDDMMNVANEILQLTKDAHIIENTKSEIAKLELLKAEVVN